MVGSCATRSREPGQARKGAAVSGGPRVPQGTPAGAGYRNGAGRSAVQDGAHDHCPFPFWGNGSPKRRLVNTKKAWRRRRDLNPWTPCGVTRSPGVPVSPLPHVSENECSRAPTAIAV
jgi:hypothetical protein